jgi:hypothetical protein
MHKYSWLEGLLTQFTACRGGFRVLIKVLLRFSAALVVLALPISGYSATPITPESGTWLISSEFDGKPGRGFQIEVQKDIMDMYFYGYTSTGQGTFYLAAGKMDGNNFTGDLGTYSGGSAFGMPHQAANYDGSAGQVTLSFNSPTTGTITLPGESAKPITRYYFGYDEQSPSSLLGSWASVYLVSAPYAFVMNLTKIDPANTTGNGSGAAESADGLTACEIQTSGTNAGDVFCVQVDSSGKLLNRFVFTQYSVNKASGWWISPTTGDTYPAMLWRVTTNTGRYTAGSVPAMGSQLLSAGTASSDGPVEVMRDQQELMTPSNNQPKTKAFRLDTELQHSMNTLVENIRSHLGH